MERGGRLLESFENFDDNREDVFILRRVGGWRIARGHDAFGTFLGETGEGRERFCGIVSGHWSFRIVADSFESGDVIGEVG